MSSSRLTESGKEGKERRHARVYVAQDAPVTEGMKALLRNNEVEYVEIDLTQDATRRNDVVEKSRGRSLPVIELNEIFASGTNILELARRLDLGLGTRPRTAENCC